MFVGGGGKQEHWNMLLEAQDRNRPASKRIESDDRRIMSRSLFVAQVTHGDTFDTWSLQSGS